MLDASSSLSVKIGEESVENPLFLSETKELVFSYILAEYNKEYVVKIESGLIDLVGNKVLNDIKIKTKINKVVSMKMSPASISANFIRGKTYTLKPVFTAEDTNKPATNRSVKYISSNPAVATVSASGVVKAVKVGSAKITVTHLAGEVKPVVVSVVFKKIPVTKVKLNKTKVKLKRKKSYQLKATVYPLNATYKTVTWKTSNKKLATVSKKGKVTAKKKKGKVKITAIADGKKAVCTITIK